MSNETFISDLMTHKSKVSFNINAIMKSLMIAKNNHDSSKFCLEERGPYESVFNTLQNSEYGSNEHKEALDIIKPAIDHHYKENRHHPEHFEDGISGMNLVDICEMISDWKAASDRKGSDVRNFIITVAKKKYNMSDDLTSILLNTVDNMFIGETED